MKAETRDQVRALVSEFLERWIADAIPAAELERIAREGVSLSGLLTPFHVRCRRWESNPHDPRVTGF